tara:strand:- start:86 stop:1270 length:1185 start_codon:yes stop_codon:yes gene_type:complete
MAVPKNFEELGTGLWGTTTYWWDPASKKYYYTNGKAGATPNVVDGGMLEVKLKKKYPRDGGESYTDYNPFLEEVSTIKTKFGGAGVAVNGAGGSVRFPHDMLIDEGEDFVMFDFYDYKPPFQGRNKNYEKDSKKVINETLEQYNASGYAGEYFKDKAYPQILLYMPQDVTDTFAAKWEGKKFGAMTTGILAAAGQGAAVDKINAMGQNVSNQLKKGTAELAAKVVTGLASKLTGDQITANDVFGGISGVVRNPNVEVLFQSMELRTFDLTFKMAPYDENDVQRMDAIIKIFKQAMLPQYKLGDDVEVFGMKNNALEAGFIQVPKVCAVNFMRGNMRNRFLPRYKMCAITDVNVNYTPDNVYATFDRSSPVATELKLSFMETKLVFSEDVQQRGF